MGWDDEITAEQRAASDQTELQRRRIASCGRYTDVIDKAAPEIARACRNLGVKSEGIKRLIAPKQWVFEIGPGANITIRSTGKWYFSDRPRNGYTKKLTSITTGKIAKHATTKELSKI